MSEKSGNQHLANGLTSLVFGKLQEFDRSRKLNPEDFFNDMLHVIQKKFSIIISITAVRPNWPLTRPLTLVLEQWRARIESSTDLHFTNLFSLHEMSFEEFQEVYICIMDQFERPEYSPELYEKIMNVEETHNQFFRAAQGILDGEDGVSSSCAGSATLE
mmetsp:Transcript_10845/g.19659  ORF Transcript_10845/g.19659 Transcript_10845/m.19659 type:complete len:160 (+) Transcript_10845:351-830(+)|eukprot:CAMPEP_0202488302 /NCGR_PEP_ID=MMETSP1361-20130828/6372_1 /ASSEMBLY_ACC=CAM_ASM_000849 /TAXON_ID=210615 /ORGANISM="Staurosira complex sp., Strain CCMP2646" /LENGTH=159 /DNA_ID=CAMNT_0049117855 /DNA_START=220 /DNA_END=699 /DNA_ORIENTATION=-